MSWPRQPVDSAPLPPHLPGRRPWPRISIVTPSFGQGLYIEDTILSVLNQGYPNVEHIVIDGGSTDHTPTVLERYRNALAHVVSEPDRGQSHAINKGMAWATGEILTWLNSDDRLAPGALAGIAMGFHTSGADLVAGLCELWRDGQLVDRHLTSCDDGPLPLEDLLDLDGCWNAGQFFFQPEVFFTRAVWDRAGGHVDEASHYSMDYELWLRFAAAGARLKVIGRPIAQFRFHEAQKTADPTVFKADLPITRERFLRSRGLRHQPPSAPGQPRPARIVFFNDVGVQYGAGIAHGRLAAATALAGHHVSVIAASPAPNGLVPSAEQQQRQLDAISAEQPDLVVVGNLHGAGLEPAFLARVAQRWRTAFVTHDLWIVTGRCAYTHGCEQLVTGCDSACPTPTEYPALSPSLIEPAWNDKRELLRAETAPLLLANSDWTRAQVQRALGSSTSVTTATITLGVRDEFFPLDKATCRSRLGLPDHAFLILLSATSLTDPRKGRNHLLDALARLDLPDVELLLVGAGDSDAVPGFRIHRFLYQTDPTTLAAIYSASDLFVGPSLEECLGQVFLEAAACGVPAVGYPVGGVPEALTHEVTGLLATDTTAAALAAAIQRLYEDADLRAALSRWARLVSENERSLEAVYHRLHAVLQRSLDDGDSLFGRKIALRPRAWPLSPFDKPLGDLVEPDTWEASMGFGPWEGPYPDWNLPRCRWQIDARGAFHLITGRAGRHLLVLRYRNLAANQRLRITCGGKTVFNDVVPVTTTHVDSILKLNVDLPDARTVVTCDASSASPSPAGYPLFILYCGMDVVPVSKPRGIFARWFQRE